MKSTPDVLFIIDTNRENIAFWKQNYNPYYSIVDTNCDPDLIDYPIPANDDGVKSVQFILDCFKKVLSSEPMKLHLMMEKRIIISMELIKKLRETTGSGMLDCKKPSLKIMTILMRL